MTKKLIAAIACRSSGKRLYGKPLQNLDIENDISILDFIISKLKKKKCIKKIVLGIAKDTGADAYKNFAVRNSIDYIFGNEVDVLSRLIKCAKKVNGTDIFRITSESPFTFYENLEKNWKRHRDAGYDATFLDQVVDGCGYEIITLKALQISHKCGKSRHRSELCTLYIRENSDKFKIFKIKPPKYLIRNDLRLTVDYPEDLIVCRSIYKKFKSRINHKKIIKYLDKNIHLKKLVKKFTIEGYKTMYR